MAEIMASTLSVFRCAMRERPPVEWADFLRRRSSLERGESLPSRSTPLFVMYEIFRIGRISDELDAAEL